MGGDLIETAETWISIFLIVILVFYSKRLYDIYKGGCDLDPFCIIRNWDYLVGKPNSKIDGTSWLN